MRRGQTLVEVMVAMGIAALLLPALLTVFFSSRGGVGQAQMRVEAVARVGEAREVVSYMRDVSWESVSVNGTYHPEVAGSSWSLVAGVETLGELERVIEIMDAYRTPEGELTTTPGTLDPSVKLVRVSVSWGEILPSELTSEYYLMRLENLTYLETLTAEFEQGTQIGTTVTTIDDGEVTLGAGGGGNWCEPGLTLAEVDLPKSGVANTISAMEGQVVVGTGENASGVSFARVSVSADDPPVGVVEGSFDGYKTNVVYGDGQYAYLATDTNQKEVVVIDLTTQDGEGKYSEVGYYNAPGNKSAEGVAVTGSIGLATVDNLLYTFDLSSKVGERMTIEGITLSGQAGEVKVVGNYAYVVITGGSSALEIVEMDGEGRNLSRVGWVSLSDQVGRAVVVNESGTRAYLVAEHDSERSELYVVDIMSKVGERAILGQYDTGEMDPEGVTAVTNGKVIVVGTGGEEYQVVSVTESGGGVSVAHCGGLEIDVGVRGVAGVIEEDGDAYAYIITGDSTSELKIIEGGPGGSFATDGVFESRVFDAGKSSVFNRFEIEEDTPSLTQIEYQVAISEVVAGSCEGVAYNFVGPDLTSGTFFSLSSQLPLSTGIGYSNPGQCMKYRAYLSTTEGTVSPSLYSWMLNYSP